ncbi:hypothetical protein [Poriferisphaera sp. WC338]|uniref:hypothetical protein n=1 Tax=Poriferisphaera sp. WC338 TaxID=3425129 RepID=UPI003D81C15A
MKNSLRYLNTILTVIALLLTLNLWAMWQGTPGGEAASFGTEAHAQGISNSGAQRKMMIDQLKLLNKGVASMERLLVSGKARVRVEGEIDK